MDALKSTSLGWSRFYNYNNPIVRAEPLGKPTFKTRCLPGQKGVGFPGTQDCRKERKEKNVFLADQRRGAWAWV